MSECRCGKPTNDQFCEDCEKTFAYSLVNVGVYYVDIEQTVEPRRTRLGSNSGGKATKGKEQPLIVDMRFVNANQGRASLAPGAQLMTDARATVVAWARHVMDEQPELAGPACVTCLHVSCSAIRRRRWPTDTIPSMVRYFSRQFRWIIHEPWAPVMADEFLDLERRLSWMSDRPASKWYAGKCSVIDENGTECTAELYAREDRGWVDCQRCGIRHDVSERRAVLLREAKHYLVTATEAASALMAWTDYDGTETKLVDRIRKWRDRGRLEVADVTSLHGKDRHLYRLGDVQDLLVGHAQRQQQQTLSA